MPKTASRASLLHVALQDLRAGKALLAERLPALAAATRLPALRTLLEEEAGHATVQRERLDSLGDVAGGPSNLWMSGILDDADRDAQSHQPGMVLDIALVGAVRKAKAAEIVSGETAIALAGSEAPHMLDALNANLREDVAADRALKDCLGALTRKTSE